MQPLLMHWRSCWILWAALEASLRSVGAEDELVEGCHVEACVEIVVVVSHYHVRSG